MDDFQVQCELPTEPMLTKSGLIASVDFFGDTRRLLCVASQKILKVFSIQGLIARLDLS